MNKNSNSKCFQCNSPLILVSKVTIRPEGSIYSQSNFIYKCSNKECQEEKDKQEVKRMQQQGEKILAGQKRIERMHEQRKLMQKLKMQ